MKKLGKITLSKKYDVLSENEMKKVVGGMGSGSGTDDVDCEGLFYFSCYEPGYEGSSVRLCASNIAAATSGFCEMPGRKSDCMVVAVCRPS